MKSMKLWEQTKTYLSIRSNKDTITRFYNKIRSKERKDVYTKHIPLCLHKLKIKLGIVISRTMQNFRKMINTR